MSPQLLGADVRRQQRPQVILIIAMIHLYKLLTSEGRPEQQEKLFLCVLAVAIVPLSYYAQGRAECLSVDIMVLVALYLNFYALSWYLLRGEIDLEKMGEFISAFTGYMQCMVAMGIHFGFVLIWFVAVWMTCWLPNLYQLQVSIFLIGFQALLLHAYMQISEVRKHVERQEAQAASVRLNKLEHDRMKQRQERVELCLGMVLHHLKAPLLLLKSELSVFDGELGEPEEVRRALEGAQSRIGQLWSIFSGLETRVLGELREDQDVDAMSQSFFAGCRDAMLPETVFVTSNGHVKEQAEPGSPRKSEEDDEQASEGAPEAIAHGGVDGKSQTPLKQAPAARRPSVRGPEVLSCPRRVRVAFDPHDPKMGIYSLTFLLADGPEEDLPGLLSLLPECRGDFQLWVQDQVNKAMYAMADGSAPVTGAAAPGGRIAFALPIMRLMLQNLLAHAGAFGEGELVFCGVDEQAEANSVVGGTDEDGDGMLHAVVELSEISLRSGFSRGVSPSDA